MKGRFSRSRRQLLRSTAFLAASGFAVAVPARVKAAELPRVTGDDPTAVALKYVSDATQSARPSADQFCHNCRYFKGTQQTEWERCDLFPGKTVNANGWCNVWAMKG